ncbi:MAG: nitroreductase family protein [Bacteroidales bacterium]
MDGLNPLISSRRAIMAFSSRPVEEAKISLLLDAARLAPSAFNAQPWRIFVARKEDTPAWNLLFESLSEANKLWVQYGSLLILILAETINPARNSPNPYAKHDCGLALQNMMLQAEYMGLGSHPMAGFDGNEVAVKLGLKDGLEPLTISAFGYPGDTALLPEALRERQMRARIRKGMDDLILRSGSV